MIKYALMQDIVKTRIAVFLAGVIFVPIVTVAVILFARGYRPNFQTKELDSTGILVAHSYPEGAQVILNGKVTSATNTTLNLTPGTYKVEIKKVGFTGWIKELRIETEIVTRATATLFPTVPTLKQLTTTGAANHTLSPDGTKAAFTSLDSKLIYTLDLNESPLGLISRESKLVYNSGLPISHLSWSPDSRQLLAETSSASASSILVDINSSQTKPVLPSDTTLIANWEKININRKNQMLDSLPPKLQQFFATTSANLDWAPRENKILYTATASAVMPDNIRRPLPGSSTQPQNRELVPGSVYVYDLEEDRNFKVGENLIPTPTPKPSKKSPILNSQLSTLNTGNAGLRWLPTSSHLIKVEIDRVIIFEYDGQNPTQVYTGPLTSTTIIPYPSAKQLLILANLTTTPTPDHPSVPNLFALTLR